MDDDFFVYCNGKSGNSFIERISNWIAGFYIGLACLSLIALIAVIAIFVFFLVFLFS